VYQGGERFHWWDEIKSRFKPPGLLSDLFKKADTESPPDFDSQVPLVFVDVNPALATAEPPKDTPFYSDKNSTAANPETDQDTNVPRITGTQEDVIKTEDIPREKPMPLQPALPTPPPEPVPVQEEETVETIPKPAMEPGDLALLRPDPAPEPKLEPQPNRSRPRTIKEAMARKNISRLPGEKMKQEGGVKRRFEVAGLDARATPFGSYDAALIEAISQRWYSLLDERDYASDSRGKVVLQFHLHYDGRVTDMNVAENTVGELLSLLCRKAVFDPSPFAPWPSDMRRLMGESRRIQFTFYYH
jgi:outer membrane biosynthesis protein TonB